MTSRVFEDLFVNDYEKIKAKLIKKYDSPFEHPFIREILNQANTEKTLDAESCKCDEVFAEYIVKAAKFVKPEYMKKLIKFVLLFRENLNTLNRNKPNVNENENYSEVYNAEDAPDNSNEFVTDYLETEDSLFEFSKEEAVELTQNFCQWMYDNNYTCSKLSLISNNH